jgi:hypothetical protein
MAGSPLLDGNESVLGDDIQHVKLSPISDYARILLKYVVAHRPLHEPGYAKQVDDDLESAVAQLVVRAAM